MAGGVVPLLPEAPVRKPGRILGEEVLPGAAGHARGGQAAAQQLGATALAGAHEVTHLWQLHPGIVPGLRPVTNPLIRRPRPTAAPLRTAAHQDLAAADQ